MPRSCLGHNRRSFHAAVCFLLQEMRNFAQKSSNEKYTRHHDIHIFTSTSLMDIMKNFSDVNGTKVVLGYLLMLVYASLSLARHDDHVNSLSFLGFTGVLLIALAVTAALGCCALIGLPFNASTTQVRIFQTSRFWEGY